MNNKEYNERLSWLDNAKGLAMLLVIVGHALQPIAASTSYSFLMFIYSFHMPLFFFISGYLFKPHRKTENTLHYIKRKATRLLIPYLFYQVLSLLFINFFSYATTGHSRDSLPSFISHFFYLKGNVGWNSPLWFLVVLFILDVLYFLFNKQSMLLKSGLIFGSFLVGWLLVHTGITYPGGLHVVFSCLLIYHVGFLARKWQLFSLLQSKLGIVIIFLCVTVVVANMLLNSNHTSLYENNVTPNYLIFYIVSLSGSIAALFFITRIAWCHTHNWLALIGRHSLFVLATQYFLLLGFDKLLQKMPFHISNWGFLVVKVFCILFVYIILLKYVAPRNFRYKKYLFGC